MTAIAPQTDVYLLKVPLELDELNQLTFDSKEAQFAYFNSVPKLEADNFTYQRKDGTIRFPALLDDIMSYNYVVYRNEAYSDKWFYAFITGMDYINDNVTAIHIKTDVWQTWMFELNFKPTFIAREHTNDDTIGNNTIPENVELGEPVINGQIVQMSPRGLGFYITFMVSDVAPLNIPNGPGGMVNQVFSGYTIFGVNSMTDAKAIIYKYIDNLQAAGYEAITNIFMVPKLLYGTPTTQILDQMPGGYSSVTIYYPESVQGTMSLVDSQTISRNDTLDGFIPVNNKLYTYPYSWLTMTNHVGGNAVYRYEDFINATPIFRMSGIINSGCDIRVAPINYKNITLPNYAYGLTLGKYPVCSWNTDSYAIWLAQNQLNANIALEKAAITGLIGVGSKNIDMLANTGSNIVGVISDTIFGGQIANETPDQVHGDPNSSNFNFSADLDISISRMSVRAEYARIIDQYFSVAGYATNQVKIPNIIGRRNWNFVKTVGCYIKADIPQDDLQEIKEMFDRGITFWHNPSTFGDYTQNNDII